MKEGRKRGAKRGAGRGGEGGKEGGRKQGREEREWGGRNKVASLCQWLPLNPLRGRLPNSVSVLGLLLGELVFVLLLLFSQ